MSAAGFCAQHVGDAIQIGCIIRDAHDVAVRSEHHPLNLMILQPGLELRMMVVQNHDLVIFPNVSCTGADLGQQGACCDDGELMTDGSIHQTGIGQARLGKYLPCTGMVALPDPRTQTGCGEVKYFRLARFELGIAYPCGLGVGGLDDVAEFDSE